VLLNYSDPFVLRARPLRDLRSWQGPLLLACGDLHHASSPIDTLAAYLEPEPQDAVPLTFHPALVLNVPLNHGLNHRLFEVTGAGVPQVVFGALGLVGEHRHLAERPDVFWASSLEQLEELVLQLLWPSPSACGPSPWHRRRTGSSRICSRRRWRHELNPLTAPAPPRPRCRRSPVADRCRCRPRPVVQLYSAAGCGRR